jgi:hypothetical protein
LPSPEPRLCGGRTTSQEHRSSSRFNLKPLFASSQSPCVHPQLQFGRISSPAATGLFLYLYIHNPFNLSLKSAPQIGAAPVPSISIGIGGRNGIASSRSLCSRRDLGARSRAPVCRPRNLPSKCPDMLCFSCQTSSAHRRSSNGPTTALIRYRH